MARKRFRLMVRILGIFLFLLAGTFPGEAKVLELTVRDTINPFTSSYIRRGLKFAQENHCEAVLLLLDTPGGLMDAMRDIVQDILASEVPVVVYVFPSGGHAGSAGAFILMSADVAAMAPGTSVGSAHPVSIGVEPMPAEMAKKAAEDAAALMRTLANRRGRDAVLAEKFVKESISLTETEARENELIDFIARDPQELLDQMDGFTFLKANREIVLHTKGKPVEKFPPNLYEQFFSHFANPNVVYILLLIGLYGVIYEIIHPGSYYPGIIGAIALIFAFIAVQNLPVRYGAIALIALGVILFVAEIKMPTHGILGVLGTIAFLVGSFLLFGSPEYQVDWGVILGGAVVVLGFLFIAVRAGILAHLQTPFVGAENLLGKTGEVVRDLSPDGLVFLEGENWRAVSDGTPIQKGESVLVVGKEGMVLRVRRKSL